MSKLYWGKIEDLRDDLDIIKNRLIALAEDYRLTYQEVEFDLNKELADTPFHISEGM